MPEEATQIEAMCHVYFGKQNDRERGEFDVPVSILSQIAEKPNLQEGDEDLVLQAVAFRAAELELAETGDDVSVHQLAEGILNDELRNYVVDFREHNIIVRPSATLGL